MNRHGRRAAIRRESLTSAGTARPTGRRPAGLRSTRKFVPPMPVRPSRQRTFLTAPHQDPRRRRPPVISGQPPCLGDRPLVLGGRFLRGILMRGSGDRPVAGVLTFLLLERTARTAVYRYFSASSRWPSSRRRLRPRQLRFLQRIRGVFDRDQCPVPSPRRSSVPSSAARLHRLALPIAGNAAPFLATVALAPCPGVAMPRGSSGGLLSAPSRDKTARCSGSPRGQEPFHPVPSASAGATVS